MAKYKYVRTLIQSAKSIVLLFFLIRRMSRMRELLRAVCKEEHFLA